MARYTDEERAQHVLMLEAAGYPKRKGALAQYAKKCGIPHPTLSRWYRHVQNPPPNKTVRKKKRDLKEALRALILDFTEHAHDAAKDAGLDPLTRGIGIATDKLLLLEGNANWRLEIIGLVKDGSMTAQQVRDELGEDLATELFDAGSIPAIQDRAPAK